MGTSWENQIKTPAIKKKNSPKIQFCKNLYWKIDKLNENASNYGQRQKIRKITQGAIPCHQGLGPTKVHEICERLAFCLILGLE